MPKEPPDEVELLKLVWHPDDLEGNLVKPTAFTSRDLSGAAGAHVSVDRRDIARREVMERTADRQAGNADGVNHKREKALIAVLSCAAVRSVTYQDKPALAVTPQPIPDNDAHCGISNISGVSGRGYLNEVRGKLAVLASPAQTMTDVYGAT